MSLISHLLIVAEAFASHRGLSRARVSTLVFNSGTKLDRIAGGTDVHTATYEAAMKWFAANWPEGAEWPADVPRPAPAEPETV